MIEIIKTELLENGFNSMEGHYWFYLYRFRLYNRDKSKCCEYAYIISFCGEDFDEYRYDEEEDVYYDSNPEDYADDLSYGFTESYKFSYENHEEFFAACKETIDKYNRRVSEDYDASTIWGMACELTRMTFGDVGSRKFVTVDDKN